MSKRGRDDTDNSATGGSGQNPAEKSKDDLLDDLETIRSLLDKEQAQAAQGRKLTMSPLRPRCHFWTMWSAAVWVLMNRR